MDPTVTEFDIEKGVARKEEGQAAVQKNDPSFKELVREVIVYAAAELDEFTNDDIRRLAEELGVPSPAHPNSWGAAISSAAKAGIIKRVGFRASAAVTRNAGTNGIWTAA